MDNDKAAHEALVGVLTHIGVPDNVADGMSAQIVMGLKVNGLTVGPSGPTSEFGPMAEAATQIHEGFDQLIQKGFSREEAFELVKVMMANVGRQM